VKPAIIIGAALICLQNIANFFKLLQRGPETGATSADNLHPG
jgi:hypothetical protein